MKAKMPTRNLPLLLVILFLLGGISATAQVQAVSLSSTLLSFSAVAIGATSGAKSATLTNIGTTSLTITSVTASGDFNETDNCVSSSPLNPGMNCTINVTYLPTVLGAILGAVTIVDSARNSPHVISLTGGGAPPVATSPASLSFGTVPVGTTSSAKTVTITNNTASAVTISSIVTSGNYNLTSNPCGASLLAGKSCNLSVTFSPTAAGTVNGAITLVDTASNSPQIVGLLGTGSGAPATPVTLFPSSVTFPSQVQGTTSSTQTITVTNNSTTTTVNISTVARSGDYTESDNCAGTPLPPSGTCMITVGFAPTMLGAITGAITVTDDASNSPQVASLSGMGIAPLSLSTSTLKLPSQESGTVGSGHSVTLTNNTGGAVTLASIVASGDYAETDNCTGAVGICTITVKFAPTNPGSILGAVTITDSASNSPQILSLAGFAIASPRFAFVPNSSDGTLSVLTVNATTGQLREDGYVFAAANTGPKAVAVDPLSRFVYVANETSNGVSGYTLNADNGTLMPVGGSPFGAGNAPVSLIVSINAKFLFVANSSDNNISVFSINQTSGALTSVGSPVSAGTTPSWLSMDPAGKFLYAINRGDNTVSAYNINLGTGALTPIGTAVATGHVPRNVAVHPAGKLAYVPNQGDSTISVYSISSLGALTPLGSPVATGTAMWTAIDLTGKYLFEGNGTAGTVSAFTINTTSGALTPLVNSPFGGAGMNADYVLIDPSDAYLYVPDPANNTISLFSISASTGALTAKNAVHTRGTPALMTINSGFAPISYKAKFTYAADAGTSQVSGYTVNTSSGVLVKASGSPYSAGNHTSWVAIHPGNQFAYVSNFNDGTVVLYTIDASSGALTQVGLPVAADVGSVGEAVDPSGRFLYVTNFGPLNGGAGGNDVSAFSIDPSTGGLSPIQPAVPVFTARAVAIDPAGRFAYVLNRDGCKSSCTNGIIVQFSIDTLTGALSGVATFAAGLSSRGISIDPSGRFLYVANFGVSGGLPAGNISAYTIDSVTGALTQVAGSPFAAGTNPLGISTDNSGKFLYSVDTANTTGNVGHVHAFAINSNGTLTAVSGSPFAAGSNPEAITVDPSNSFVYVTNFLGNSLSGFKLSSSTGKLTTISGSPFGSGGLPSSVVVEATIQ